MEVRVTARPHLLLESVELIFAYVNEILPQMLTAPGEHCLAEEAVREMMETACSDIPRTDPAVEYYFSKYIFPDGSEKSTCIARNLAYDSMCMSKGSIQEDCENLCSLWKQNHRSCRIDAISEYGLSYRDADERQFIPLANDIAKLGLSAAYSQKLLEQFSGYDMGIYRLQKIVEPVAERLQPLLEPWVKRAEPLAQLWQQQLEQPDGFADFMERLCYSGSEKLELLELQLRYILPKAGPGSVSVAKRTTYIHMGTAMTMGKRSTEGFEAWEIEAFRLLGSFPRLRMLSAMMNNPMSARELAQSLNLNLGTVFKDINSMYESRLIVIETVNSRRRYRTNMETFRLLGKHISEFDDFRL